MTYGSKPFKRVTIHGGGGDVVICTALHRQEGIYRVIVRHLGSVMVSTLSPEWQEAWVRILL